MQGIFDLHRLLPIRAVFTAGGLPADPSAVTFRIRNESMTAPTVIVYDPTGGPVKRTPSPAPPVPLPPGYVDPSAGLYFIQWKFELPGYWFWSWEGSGAVESVIEDSLLIRDSMTGA